MRSDKQWRWGEVVVCWRYSEGRTRKLCRWTGCGVWVREKGVKDDFGILGVGIQKKGVVINWWRSSRQSRFWEKKQHSPMWDVVNCLSVTWVGLSSGWLAIQVQSIRRGTLDINVGILGAQIYLKTICWDNRGREWRSRSWPGTEPWALWRLKFRVNYCWGTE